MACFYYKGDKKYLNPKEMIQDFLKDDRLLDSSDASIFSSFEIQKNIVDRIKELHNPKTFESENYTPDLDFISNPNISVFREIPELADVKMLTPKYIEENRAMNYVKDRLNDPITVVNNAFVDNDRFVKIMKDPEIAAAKQDVVKTILAEYEDILRVEEGTKEIARIIKSFIIANVNGKAPENMDVLFDKLYKKDDAITIYGENTVRNRQAWYDKIMSIAETIKTKVTAKGEVLTDLRVVSTPENFVNGKLVETNTPRVSSKIDIVAVGSDGMTHIFDIKTSKKPFSNWDTAKVLTSDWALAIKRQMLGQKIDINRVALYVIPITVDALGDASNVKVGDFKARTNDETTGLRDNGYINIIADKLLPRKIFPVYNPERTNKLKNRLKQVIDDVYEVRTEAEDTNVDKIVQIAERSFKRNGDIFRYYNAYSGIPGINNGRKGNIEVIPKSLKKADVAAAKAEFTSLIEKYVEFVKQQDNRGVSILYDAITHALTSGEKISTRKHQQRLRYILYEYLNKD